MNFAKLQTSFATAAEKTGLLGTLFWWDLGHNRNRRSPGRLLRDRQGRPDGLGQYLLDENGGRQAGADDEGDHQEAGLTAPDPLTGKEFIETAAQAFGVDVRYRVLSKSMIRLAGLFDKTVAKSYEMLYQNEFPYIFDSSKFETSFRMGLTSYRDGIRKTAEAYMTRGSA